MLKLYFQLQPSKYLAGILALMYLGAIANVMLLDFFWSWLKLGCGVFLGFSFFFIWRRYVLLQGIGVITQFWVYHDHWLLGNTSGSVIRAYLDGNSVVSNQVLVLNFLTEAKKHLALIIFKDAMIVDDFRVLKIQLSIAKIPITLQRQGKIINKIKKVPII